MGFGVGRAGSDHTVQLDGDLGAFDVDLDGVPAATGFIGGIRRGDVDQAAGGVVLRRVLILDLAFIGARGGVHHFRVGGAHIDAAVGVVRGPEFRVDLEVTVILFGDQYTPFFEWILP